MDPSITTPLIVVFKIVFLLQGFLGELMRESNSNLTQQRGWYDFYIRRDIFLSADGIFIFTYNLFFIHVFSEYFLCARLKKTGRIME